ncbi:MAG: hypothetical protein AB7J32_14775 [Pseudonocardia sp.]
MDERVGALRAPRIQVASTEDVAAALDGSGPGRERTVIVLVGGAGGLGEEMLAALADVLRDEVVPVAEQRKAVVVDGGTDSGVMRLIGRARAAAGGGFPLVGVAAEGTVVAPEARTSAPDAAALEPNHTLFLLVPGANWGDETAWIAEVAGVVAGDRPSVTLLVNGGPIAYDDVDASLTARRRVVVLAGSGRAADAIADVRAGRGGDDRAAAIAASPLTSVAHIGRPGAVAAAIEAALEAP